MSLISRQTTQAVRSCQLPCFRESEVLSIKFCPECARDDANYFGVGYWHRCHQIPGIEACHKHKVWLVHIPWEGRSFLKKGFFPPVDADSKVCTEISADLAAYSMGILNQVSSHGQKCFDISNIQQKLRTFGYLTELGRNRRKLIAQNLYDFTSRFQYPSNDLLPRSSTDFNYISYLLSHGIAQHPFKYLLVDFWLSTHVVRPRNHVEDNVTKVTKNQLDNNCISLLRQGASMAEVSRKIGRSRCYIKALALKLDIAVNLKPRVITAQMQLKIMLLARKGFHRKVISKRIGVSVGSVEQQISTSPDLVKWRKHCRHDSKKRRYKVNIIRYQECNPCSTRQQIKVACYAAFYWLYKHEPLWLERHLPKATLPKTQPRVDCR